MCSINSWSFAHVTDGYSESIPIMKERGALKKLVDLLTASCFVNQSVHIPAIHTVGNLLAGNDEQTDLIISYGVLQQFSILLLLQRSEKDVVWAISNITAGTEEQIQAVVDTNLIFPQLIHIISSEYEVALKREAIWVFKNALDGGTLLCMNIRTIVRSLRLPLKYLDI